MVVNLDLDTVLLWIIVGLVAGFFASHLTLGRGLGLTGDVIAGVIGALLGGLLTGALHLSIAIVGHPVLSEMVVAFLGAVVLLLILRLFGARRCPRRRASCS